MIQVLRAFRQQLGIQFFQVFHPGQRHTDIAAYVTHQVFHQTLFIAGCRITENRLKTVVRGKLAVIILGRSLSPKSTLDRNPGVVENEPAGDAAEILESVDNGIQEALQILPLVRNDIRGTAMAEPGTKEIDFLFLSIHEYCGFAPVNLYGISWRKAERNINLTDFPFRSQFVYKIANRGFAAAKTMFFHKPLIYPARSVTLLLDAIRIVFIQTVFYELNHFGRHDCCVAIVRLVIPRNIVTFPVFLHGVPGNP